MTFILSRSPFLIRLSLVILSFCLRIILLINSFSWMFYTLIILFLGGIIIVFIYISSLNSIFKISLKRKLVIPIFILIMIFIKDRFLSNKFNDPWINFNFMNYISIIFIVVIILLRLFIIVKLVSINEGPIKI